MQKFPPLKQAESEGRDDLSRRFEDKINRYVEQQLDKAFSSATDPGAPRSRRFPWRRSRKT